MGCGAETRQQGEDPMTGGGDNFDDLDAALATGSAIRPIEVASLEQSRERRPYRIWVNADGLRILVAAIVRHDSAGASPGRWCGISCTRRG
jgi:hypothetical protein